MPGATKVVTPHRRALGIRLEFAAARPQNIPEVERRGPHSGEGFAACVAS